MAIQLRRGNYTNFDPSKMRPGEVAVVQTGDPNTRSGKAMYIAPTSNEVKRVAFVDDVEEIVYNISEGIAEEINDQVAENVNAAQTAANDAANSAQAAAQHVTTFKDTNSDGNITITIGSGG